MNVAVIGNGAIGLCCAYELYRRYPSLQISLFGSNQNKYGASLAAGAMINVASEIDCFNCSHKLTAWKMSNRKEVLNLWRELEQSFLDKKVINKNIIDGGGTEVVIDNDSSNEVELNSFKSMKKCLQLYGYKIQSFSDQKNSSLLINDEKSVDAELFIQSLIRYLGEHIKIYNIDIESIKKNSKFWELTDYSGATKHFTHVVIACGAWSEGLIKRSNLRNKPNIKSFFGVGSALLTYSELPYVQEPKIDKIIRTPNRGGTCGIHSVQRSNGLYIGASSLITDVEIQSPRMSSIESILEGARKTIGINTYQLSFSILTGYRPVTLDAVPIIGELDENLFCLYGTKRDGFTWAPYYAKHLVNQIFGEINSNWQEMLNLSSPFRTLISAGDFEKCVESYVLNKKYEAFQHGFELTNNEIDNLREIAIKAHKRISQDLSFGLQPELINMIAYSN